MLKTLCILIAITAFTAVAPAQQRTKIEDASAAKMLAGRHRLSLQWISWEKFGSAIVTTRSGYYRILGQQKLPGSSDYLRINGEISSISAKEFVFNGTVEMQVSHINDGKPCVRKGEMIFRITGKRRYWRLQQMDSPCDTTTDYVDIYFR